MRNKEGATSCCCFVVVLLGSLAVQPADSSLYSKRQRAKNDRDTFTGKQSGLHQSHPVNPSTLHEDEDLHGYPPDIGLPDGGLGFPSRGPPEGPDDFLPQPHSSEPPGDDRGDAPDSPIPRAPKGWPDYPPSSPQPLRPFSRLVTREGQKRQMRRQILRQLQTSPYDFINPLPQGVKGEEAEVKERPEKSEDTQKLQEEAREDSHTVREPKSNKQGKLGDRNNNPDEQAKKQATDLNTGGEKGREDDDDRHPFLDKKQAATFFSPPVFDTKNGNQHKRTKKPAKHFDRDKQQKRNGDEDEGKLAGTDPEQVLRKFLEHVLKERVLRCPIVRFFPETKDGQQDKEVKGLAKSLEEADLDREEKHVNVDEEMKVLTGMMKEFLASKMPNKHLEQEVEAKMAALKLHPRLTLSDDRNYALWESYQKHRMLFGNRKKRVSKKRRKLWKKLRNRRTQRRRKTTPRKIPRPRRLPSHSPPRNVRPLAKPCLVARKWTRQHFRLRTIRCRRKRRRHRWNRKDLASRSRGKVTTEIGASNSTSTDATVSTTVDSRQSADLTTSTPPPSASQTTNLDKNTPQSVTEKAKSSESFNKEADSKGRDLKNTKSSESFSKEADSLSDDLKNTQSSESFDKEADSQSRDLSEVPEQTVYVGTVEGKVIKAHKLQVWGRGKDQDTDRKDTPVYVRVQYKKDNAESRPLLPSSRRTRRSTDDDDDDVNTVTSNEGEGVGDDVQNRRRNSQRRRRNRQGQRYQRGRQGAGFHEKGEDNINDNDNDDDDDDNNDTPLNARRLQRRGRRYRNRQRVDINDTDEDDVDDADNDDDNDDDDSNDDRGSLGFIQIVSHRGSSGNRRRGGGYNQRRRGQRRNQQRRNRYNRRRRPQRPQIEQTPSNEPDDDDDNSNSRSTGRHAHAQLPQIQTINVNNNDNNGNNGDNGSDEGHIRSPFINHRTAYDFLSTQARTRSRPNVQGSRPDNEQRSEQWQFVHTTSESLCELFDKHFVRTNIGGRCE